MQQPRIVLDTNVLIAALRSPSGASFQLLQRVGQGYFETCISVPLALEYESVAKREAVSLVIDADDIDHLIDYLCQVSRPTEVFYTWRPQLRDANDEMVLELAISGQADGIVTFNKRDFAGVERFGLRLLTPVELLQEIGVLK